MENQLAIQTTARRETYEVDDLVTVKLFENKVSCARVIRRQLGTTWIQLIGFNIPAPYELGDRLPLDDSAIIDWD